MATDERRNEMIRRGRIILGPWDAFAHYQLIYAMGSINIFMIVMSWNKITPKASNTTLINKDILIFTVINIFLLTAFYLIQRERLKLRKETIDLETDEILRVINEVGKSFDWMVDILTKDFIQADTIRILGTDNRITIFICDKCVYVNCRTKYGDIPGMFKQQRIAESFLSALRMRSYEVKHQREKLNH